jgi:hypothetical protein
MTAASTIPNTDITGLGTASTKDAGVANGVATLDGSGTVPVSQLPAAVLGALSYQGTWNASTNTPTLTSSVGTKGYYYVVSVAGSTNLNGITDWQVGDWAVYNGSAWQKIDNTDAVTSVNGKTGTVVLTYSDVGAFPATSTTGSGNVVLATGATQAHPTISDYETFTSTSAPSYAEGELWYDSTQKALTYYNDVTNNQVHIGQEVQLKVINNTGSSIANGTPVYVTGTSSGQTYPNIALAKADASSTSAVLGLTNGTIASGAVGYVCTAGLLTPCNTGSFTVGQVLYLSPYSAGQLMNTVPPTGYAVQVGVVAYANSPNGSIYVKQTTPLAVSASTIIGQVAVANGGTGAATLTGYVKGSGTSAMTASSTIPTTDLSGTITNAQLANSAITINGTSTSLGGSVSVGTVTSVAATAGTGISVTGSPITSSGTLNITNTAPDQTVVLTAGTGISTSGTYPNFTITNTSPSSGGTVTSVTGTAPIVSSGGNTPAISMPAATSSVNGYLTSADWTTFNGKQPAGTYVTSVAATSPVTSSGGTTPTIAMPAATTSVSGYLTSTDWNTFNNKGSGTITSVSGTTNQITASTVSGAVTVSLPTSVTTGQYIGNASITGSSTQGAFAYGTLGYSDVNHILTMASSQNNYIQMEIQNTNAGASASSDVIVGNNNTTSSTYYGDFGMNSGGWAGTGAFNSPNTVYLTSTTGDLALGTTTSNQIRFAVNGSTTDALTIATTGAVTTPNQLTGATVRASNGIVVNSKTIAASYTIASGDNAMSAGPVTVASGQSVTVSSGSRWVVL